MIDPAVTVVIVSYNSFPVLGECLRSIQTQTSEVPVEVIVVDNASDQGDPEVVEREFPGVCVVRNQRNLGFGRANNVGARRARGRYLFFLNPDTLLTNNAIKMFLTFMDSPAAGSVGAVGGWLLTADGTATHSYGTFRTHTSGGLLDSEVRRVRRWFAPSRVRRGRAADESLRPPMRVVPWIVGADLFCRRTAFEQVGGFDERFFLYSEEVDLQKRMRQEGWRQALITGPRIVHLQGKGSDFSAARRAHFLNGMLLYLRIHYGPCSPAAALTLLRCLWIVEILVLLLSRRSSPRGPATLLRRVRLLAGWREGAGR